MIELWSLMDTPMEEQQMYEHVTCNIAASEDEITAPSSLSLETIEQVKLSSFSSLLWRFRCNCCC